MTSIEREPLPVMLSIRGEQYFDGIDPDAQELMTEGTTTTFAVEGGRVTLRRSGTVNSQMIFEEGKQHTSLYETPFGELTVDIQTSRLAHSLTERGGIMEIKYSIAVEHTVTGRNCFKIRVRRKH